MKRMLRSLIGAMSFLACISLSQYGYANGIAEPTSAGDLSFVYSSYPLAAIYESRDNHFYMKKSYESLGFSAPGSLTIVGSLSAIRDVVILLGPGQDFGRSRRIISGPLNLHVDIQPQWFHDGHVNKDFIGAYLTGTIGGTRVLVTASRFFDEDYIDPQTLRRVRLDSLLYVMVQFADEPRYSYAFFIPQ